MLDELLDGLDFIKSDVLTKNMQKMKHNIQRSSKITTPNIIISKSKSTLQPKLAINQPGDRYEQEADHLADAVMGMSKGDTPILQRMSLSPVSSIQRASSAEGGVQTVPPVVSEVLSSGGGQPLDVHTRQFMESRFGRDFSQVRVHTDSRAAESAAAIQARAYTSGQNVVFGKGAYRPESAEGKRLLAHELGHIEQQEGRGFILQKQEINETGETNSQTEVEAYQATTISTTPTQNSLLQVQSDMLDAYRRAAYITAYYEWLDGKITRTRRSSPSKAPLIALKRWMDDNAIVYEFTIQQFNWYRQFISQFSMDTTNNSVENQSLVLELHQNQMRFLNSVHQQRGMGEMIQEVENILTLQLEASASNASAQSPRLDSDTVEPDEPLRLPTLEESDITRIENRITEIVIAGDLSERSRREFAQFGRLESAESVARMHSLDPEMYQIPVVTWLSRNIGPHLNTGFYRDETSNQLARVSLGTYRGHSRYEPGVDMAVLPIDMNVSHGRVLRVAAPNILDLNTVISPTVTTANQNSSYQYENSAVVRVARTSQIHDTHARLDYGVRGRQRDYQVDISRILGALVMVRTVEGSQYPIWARSYAMLQDYRRRLQLAVIHRLSGNGWQFAPNSSIYLNDDQPTGNISGAFNPNCVITSPGITARTESSRRIEIRRMLYQTARNELTNIIRSTPTSELISSESTHQHARDAQVNDLNFADIVELHAQVGQEAHSSSGTEHATLGSRSAQTIWIRHEYRVENGSPIYVFVKYAHLYSVRTRVGAIQQGDILGSVGSTGNAISPHGHVEIVVKNNPNYTSKEIMGWLTPFQFFSTISSAE